MSFYDQLNKAELNLAFLTSARIRMTALLSGAMLLISIASLATQGLSFGIDFTGGTLVEVDYKEAVELEEVRTRLHENGYPDAVVQHFGSSSAVVIRLPVDAGATQSLGENATEKDVADSEKKANEALSTKILGVLEASGKEVTMNRVEFVGPQVGGELIEKGGMAMLITLIGILIYVAIRFEYRFAIGAVTALVHDSLITVGIFSLLQLEFDLTVLAAVLAVIGYSLNDTIVVFDRIRDNFLKMRKRDPREVMNASLNQTLIRTIMTSVTTLLVVLALFFLGGKLIHNFAAALIVGIVVGTYSSIYVASSVTLAMGVSKADLVSPVQKETGDPSGAQV